MKHEHGWPLPLEAKGTWWLSGQPTTVMPLLSFFFGERVGLKHKKRQYLPWLQCQYSQMLLPCTTDSSKERKKWKKTPKSRAAVSPKAFRHVKVASGIWDSSLFWKTKYRMNLKPSSYCRNWHRTPEFNFLLWGVFFSSSVWASRDFS